MRYLFLSVLALALSRQAPAPAPVPLEEKLQVLKDRYENGSRDPKEIAIEEAEANDYLRRQSGTALPAGVENPWTRFEEGLTVVGATVDLEKFRSSLPDSMVFQLLRGRVPVEVTARVTGENGTGKIDLERVLLAGIELPSSLVTAIAESERASEFLPPGFRLGEPFELPFDLEAIRCRLGSVLVRQGPTLLDK